MRVKAAVCALSISLLVAAHSGCAVAAAVAAGAYASGKADADRKAFHEHNLERERAGLQPLSKEEWLKRTPPETSNSDA
jgi:hypothetical protein